ncbi:MAG: elongation factor Ts [Candidatus Pacebacteria bacterium]|nr:elongation factor Ts [Candidatus Paceibacterota bacterium]MCK5591865.1 elongation factor Ts [Candidatus Paceibacterota bacterium]
MITTEQIKELRNSTGISVMQCKKALEEAGGDMEKATMLLKKKAGAAASKKSERSLGAGVTQAYIHSNHTVGVLVELGCETDFVAKNKDFTPLALDIAMHIAAMSPEYISGDDITKEDRKKVTEMFQKEVDKADKPKEIKEKMITGKVDGYFAERVLLDQKFIKDPDVTIKDLLNDATHKFGERVEVVRFKRFEVGKE